MSTFKNLTVTKADKIGRHTLQETATEQQSSVNVQPEKCMVTFFQCSTRI